MFVSAHILGVPKQMLVWNKETCNAARLGRIRSLLLAVVAWKRAKKVKICVFKRNLYLESDKFILDCRESAHQL